MKCLIVRGYESTYPPALWESVVVVLEFIVWHNNEAP